MVLRSLADKKQEPTENVKRIPVACILDREAVPKVDDKFAELVTPVKLYAGISLRWKQLLNIELIFWTSVVSNRGIV